MRIAIFSDTFPPEVNGVANFVFLSARTLATMGHEVRVYTASRVSQKKLNEKLGKKFKIFTVPSIHSPIYPNTRLPLPTGLTFPNLVKFDPHIVHAHTPFTLGWEAIMGARILKIPLLGTHHTFFDHYLKHAKIDFRAARRATWKYTVGFYNFCDLVTTPSRSLAQEMKSYGLKKPVLVLPNFVNTELFKPVGKSDKNYLKKQLELSDQTIVYMGRLSYEKSVDTVINSFALAYKKNPNLRFLIVGDGPERKKLGVLAGKLRLKKAVIFTGFLRGKELIKALQASDVFVTASKSETFCISALEAMALGLPIITGKEKGLRELVQNNKNGFLVYPNVPERMAFKILKIFSEKEILNKFGLKARSVALTYSEEKIIKKLENVYTRLTKEKQ